MQKCQTPQFLEPPSFTGIWAPLFQVATQNSKIRFQIVFGLVERFPIWNVPTSQHKNSQRRQDSWKQTFARSGTWWWAPWSWVTNTTIQLLLCTDCKHLAKIQSSSQKLFNLWTQTDRHIFHPCWQGRDFFTLGNLYLFTSLC